jgi:hypothetical protein
MNEPGHCITNYASVADGSRGPSAIWTFTDLHSAQAWQAHLRRQWRQDAGPVKQRARIFDRTIRVCGITVVVYCLVLDERRQAAA